MQTVITRNVNTALEPLLGLLLKYGRGETNKADGTTRLVMQERVTLTLERPLECAFLSPNAEVNPIYRLGVAIYEHCDFKDFRWLESLSSGDYYDDNLSFNPNIQADFVDDGFLLTAKLEEAELVGHLLGRIALELALMSAVTCSSTKHTPLPMTLLIDELWLDTTRHLKLIENAAKGFYAGSDPYAWNQLSTPIISTDRHLWREEGRMLLSTQVQPIGLVDPFMKRVVSPLFEAMREYKDGDAYRAGVKLAEVRDFAWRTSALNWMQKKLELPKELR